MLRPAVPLPGSTHVERVLVEHADAAWSTPSAPRRVHVDAVRPAADRARHDVAGLLGHFIPLGRLHEPRPPRIGLRVDDVDPRRLTTGDDEVPSPTWRVRRAGAMP